MTTSVNWGKDRKRSGISITEIYNKKTKRELKHSFNSKMTGWFPWTIYMINNIIMKKCMSCNWELEDKRNFISGDFIKECKDKISILEWVLEWKKYVIYAKKNLVWCLLEVLKILVRCVLKQKM